jgi:Nuclease A inhibitor-like protein
MATTRSIDGETAYLTGVANRLALALAGLVADQMLLSEGDMPFEPFTAAFPVERRVNATSLREELGFDGSRTVVLTAAAAFFADVAAAADEEGDQQARQAWAVVETVMHGTMGRLHVARVRGDGVVEVPFLLFGRLAGGPLVGIRSIAIET